ncbi:TetR family transcriptional regulator [Vibrio crassostreae]|uniref:DUF6262 family protein n=1 Tax=Vibrio crassostreae TaxID=246167 RepID=UPI00104F73F9|nr:DUF6262 family protein [Vibrio crassostreae]TCN82859.1 hypothetical protein EDB37_102010 [Vibrio crassostreae]CAK2397413.1 TetR family transcriptional regulator [Vibrio crassostreae]CAK2440737.1 TetR family transcriptional regulator [Vibrio crassostreae]CAK3567043.1 TetR family transcriptional regulator [Vibrio crassostreae]CAK3842761.1 TetR family transcriptional regulator [Vibrio crassostreae]
MSTRDKLKQALSSLLDERVPITVSAVAKRCGVSHSLIYNNHPDIKDDIKRAKNRQKEEQQAEINRTENEKLVKKVSALEAILKKRKSRDDQETINILIAHITEIYSMYDALLKERNDYAERLYEIEKK